MIQSSVRFCCFAKTGVTRRYIRDNVVMNKFLNLVRVFLGRFLVVFCVVLLAWIILGNWSFIFKKRIIGEVVKVERIAAPVAIVNNAGDPLNKENFSFSVAIKDLNTTEIHVASSEDRKWGAVQPGNCVVAAFFPYPPWNFSRGMTDHNARLLRNFETCSGQAGEPSFWDRIQFFFLWI